ncbi:TonB-dependent receptor [Anseongella ginsenosidimutans]|nr:TonB-dependent receptor [Anseongella ginsenosidimutans]
MPGAAGEGTTYEVLDPYADLNFGASYKINTNFGIFLNANNVLNKQYERYLNYQGMGFNMMAGLTFSL